MIRSASAAALLVALMAAAPVRAACIKDADCGAGKTCQAGKCVARSVKSDAAKVKSDTAKAATSPADASSPVSKSPAPADAGKASIALFGLYSWGGVGLGGRVEWPVLMNAVKEVQWRNDIFAVGGVEYYTQSYNTFGSYRWNFVRVEAGAMWNFWFLENFAAYPKLTLGYDAAWLSGWNNAYGPTPSGGGLAFEGAVGVIYNITPAIQLRGELGTSSIKAGVGFHFM